MEPWMKWIVMEEEEISKEAVEHAMEENEARRECPFVSSSSRLHHPIRFEYLHHRRSLEQHNLPPRSIFFPP